ncbi:hypothetical protein LCGC14_1444490 [marine sediment metagenome]|uniref:Uncharacterized protein n=1 Tax=marine sediment metagenome TaxID=412755 RepID=A0A0F9MLI6_9ZZZZ
MARLSLTCRQAVSTATTGGSVEVDRRVLVRTGGQIPANAIIDINNPGPGWALLGVPVTFSGSTEFTESTQVYRNGEIQLTGASASDDNDVYFVAASGSIAFEYNIQTNDVVQVWKFTQTTASG